MDKLEKLKGKYLKFANGRSLSKMCDDGDAAMYNQLVGLFEIEWVKTESVF